MAEGIERHIKQANSVTAPWYSIRAGGAVSSCEKLIPKPIHPFPARMAAAIPWDELGSATERPLRVLDPMAGSGTTLVVARTLGHSAIGFDSDPLAVLLASTWCSDVSESAVTTAAENVLRHARADARMRRLADAYPAGADEETCRFIRYWFDETNRKQLSALASTISRVTNRSVRAMLWCAFSRLIITKQASASRALDLAHSRPHRVDSRVPIRPFKHFLSAVNAVIKAAPFKKPTTSGVGARALVRRGDARSLPLEGSSVDVIITSPPYLNAIDYMRAHKFSLVWMRHSVNALRDVRAANIGTEAGHGQKADRPVLLRALRSLGEVEKLSERHRAMLVQYLRDMDAALSEMARVLVLHGRAILVVGDCSMRGVYVRNSAGLNVLAEHHGLALESSSTRDLPPNRRYLPPPCASNSGATLRNRMRSESILRLRKAA